MTNRRVTFILKSSLNVGAKVLIFFALSHSPLTGVQSSSAAETVETELGSFSGELRDKIAGCCEVGKGEKVGFECPKTPKSISCLQTLVATQSKSVERSWSALIHSFDGKKAVVPAMKCIERADSKMSAAIHSDFTSVKQAVECLGKIIPTEKVRDAFKTFKNQYLGFEAIADRCLIAIDQVAFTSLDQGKGKFTPKVQKYDKKCRPDLVFSSAGLKAGDQDKLASDSRGKDGREGIAAKADADQKSARLLPEEKRKMSEKGSDANQDGFKFGGVTYDKCDRLFPSTSATENCAECKMRGSGPDSQGELVKVAGQLNMNPFAYEQKVLLGEDKEHGKMTSVSYIELLRLEGFERTLKTACWLLGKKAALPQSCRPFAKGHSEFNCAEVAEVQPWAPPSDTELAIELENALGLYSKANEQVDLHVAKYQDLLADQVYDAPAGAGPPADTAEMREVKSRIEELKKYMGGIVAKNSLLAAGVTANVDELWNAKNLPALQLLRSKKNHKATVESIKPHISQLKKLLVNDTNKTLTGFCSRDPRKGGVEDTDIMKQSELQKGVEAKFPGLAVTFQRASQCIKDTEEFAMDKDTPQFVGMSLLCGSAMLGTGITLGATAPLTLSASAACSIYFLDDALKDKEFAEKKAQWTQACMKASQSEACNYEDYLRAREEYESAASALKFAIITLPLDFGALELGQALFKMSKKLPASKLREVSKRIYGLGKLGPQERKGELAAIAKLLGRDPSEFKIARPDVVKRYLVEVENAGNALRAAKSSGNAERIAEAQKQLDAALADKNHYQISKTEMVAAQKARVAENKNLLSQKYDNITDPEVKAALLQRDAQSAEDLGVVAKKAEADGVKVKSADDLPLVSERELARTKKDFPDLYKLFPDEHETTVSRAIQALEKDGYSATDVKRILSQNKKNCGMFPGQLDYCASIAGSIEKRFTDPNYLNGAKAKSPIELANYTDERFVLICKFDCPGECKPKSKIPGVGIVLPQDDQLVCESSWRAHEQEKLRRAQKFGFLGQ